MQLSVREVEISDIEIIADYWLNSDPVFMKSLGVDLDKLPSRDEIRKHLTAQVSLGYPDKSGYGLILELDGQPIGHTSCTPIQYGVEASMHLHIWSDENRRRGLGSRLIPMALPYFFNNLSLERLVAEPFAQNPAPNRLLSRLGYTFVKSYVTTPSSLSFEQEVIRWELTRIDFESLY